jgi:hypothetical protein
MVLWQAKPPARRGLETAGSPMKADDVQIDQQLSRLDAVVAAQRRTLRFRARSG